MVSYLLIGGLALQFNSFTGPQPGPAAPISFLYQAPTQAQARSLCKNDLDRLTQLPLATTPSVIVVGGQCVLRP